MVTMFSSAARPRGTRIILAIALLFPLACGHGQMTYPPSRGGGSLAEGGHCESRACMWFTQPTEIPGEPTLLLQFRTVNMGFEGGPGDWSRRSPWRAPGTAPVSGSGCGISGGNGLPIPNGGAAWPDMLPQGTDGLLLPRREPTVWRRGSVEEVAFAMSANHGGGYSYRLCRLDGKQPNVSEACFQQTVLRFADTRQWLQYDASMYQYDTLVTLPRFELPLVVVSNGTFPPGSQWARNPVPACKLCDQYDYCGPAVPLNLSEAFQPGYWYGNQTLYGGKAWFDSERCHQHCAGHNLSACPPGMTQFREPLPGLSGYSGAYASRQGLPYSIVDKVEVPADLEEGDYLLSWRWDCEQTPQIWQSCADILVV